MARTKRKSIHYVNNADFSQAVVDYVTIAEQAKKKKQQIPKVPDYVAQCFLRIAEGLSHKANFIQSGIEIFIDNELGDTASQHVVDAFVDTLRGLIDKVKSHDSEIKEFAKKEKKKRSIKVDSDLSEFM